MSFNIRELQPQDAITLKEIELVAGLSPWSLEDYEKESHRGDALSFVAESDGAVVGFLIARSNPPDCDLLNIAVRNEFRRRGIGEQLLNRLVAYSVERGGGSIYLEVREGNEGARAYYEARGFILTGLRKEFYSHPPENAILMQKIVK